MTSAHIKMLRSASHSPWRFLTGHVKTHDPERGIAAFPGYPYLRELIETVSRERFLLVPKSRQMMVTWTMVGYFLWRALFRGPGLYLFLSRNERCAEELLERARLVLSHLPPGMRPRPTVNSRQELAFGGLGSRMLSLPASPHGPRMYSPTGVFWDEMAFTPYDEQIWSALKPALDSGGSFVGVSSSGGAHNLFARFVKDASSLNPLTSCGGKEIGYPHISNGGIKGGNPFHILSIHYSLHPERNNENWKQRAAAGLSAARWNQEQEISFDSVSDLVYTEFDTVRHLLPSGWRVNAQCDLYRSIDFGYRHPYVMWIQRAGDNDFVVFDEWVGTDATTEQMIRAIRAIDLRHGINERDIRFTACDPAGAQAKDVGISPVDALRSAGIKLRYRSSRIQPGVERIKSALADAAGRTALRITENCTKLIADFCRYRWSPLEDEPLKDGESDHSMDALRYFFVNLESADEMPVQVRVAGWR